MKQTMGDNLSAHIEVMKGVLSLQNDIDLLVERMKMTLDAGGKILIAGNGGSASDAQHFAAELVGCFEVKNRRGLAAISLTTDTSTMTSISNDFGFERLFSRQLEALAKTSDLFIGISTSGSSPNIREAVQTAHRMKVEAWALSGKGGGELNPMMCERNIVVPSDNTARIQEAHIFIIHYICQQLDLAYSVETQVEEL